MERKVEKVYDRVIDVPEVKQVRKSYIYDKQIINPIHVTKEVEVEYFEEVPVYKDEQVIN